MQPSISVDICKGQREKKKQDAAINKCGYLKAEPMFQGVHSMSFRECTACH
jgi:hypothetical protein